MKKILIIDDSSELRALMRLTLEGEGYEVHEAENGIVGIDLIDTVRPDLVLLDVSMPVMTGPQLIVELARRAKTHSFEIITMSGRRIAGHSPTKWFLLKPVSASLLKAVVRDFCGRSAAAAAA
jgi:DNA-binding response OmpR family regulator